MVNNNLFNYLLEQFSINGIENDESGTSVENMKDEQVMKQLITRRTVEFGGTDNRAGGASMMRSFGQLFTAHVYMYSLKDQWLTYEHFTFVEKGKKAEIHLGNPLIRNVSQNRDDAFLDQIRTIFTEFRPIIECIAKMGHLPIQQVWGLLCNPFYVKYYEWCKMSGDDQQKKLQNDLQLIKSIKPDIFGLKRNPFDVSLRYVDNWKESIEPVRIKTACCMSYLKASGNNCYSCPKITNEQRAERGKELLINQSIRQVR